MMGHALFSPSSAHRWMQCPGSLALSQGIDRDGGGEASREGTMLHEVMQKHLEKLKPLTKFSLTEEQLAACSMCADYVRAIPKEDTFYEVKVDYGDWIGKNKECFGTSDVLIANGDTLRVVDYKFGRRWVDPKNNWQGIIYMMGAVSTMDIAGYSFDNFEFEILQPRVGEEVSNGVYKLTYNELQDKATEVTAAIIKAEQAIKFYKPGDTNEDWNSKFLHPSEEACTFCPAAATCPKLIDMAMMDAEEMEKLIMEFPSGSTMEWASNNDLSARYDRLPILKEYIKAVEDEMMKRLMDGKEVKNYHLIKGREGNREWADADAAAKELFNILEHQAYSEPELLSPAKIQSKLVSVSGMSKTEAKAMVDGLTTRAPAKPTVAHVDKGGIPWVNEENVKKEFDVF